MASITSLLPRSRRLPWALLLALSLSLPSFPSAAAAPSAPGSPSVPEVWPTPRQIEGDGRRLTVPDRVVEVVGPGTDPSAREVVEAALRAAGADRIVTVPAGKRPPAAGLTVYVGGPDENPATRGALRRLGAGSPAGLPAEGYVLASGRSSGRALLALSGTDTTGTFYAAQTLRQLLAGGRLPEVTVRDWPTAALRGVVEGFYGTPWSHAERLSQLDFYGRTKQNVYVYSPKDDPYLRERWRDEYPAARLAQVRELVERAAANHVRFTYALSPGLSVCYSSDDDITALVRKFASLYDIGVRSFAIPLDDISYTKWNCAADEERFGSGGGAAGSAQAHLLNRVWEEFSAGRTELDPLEMVPTEYSDLADTPYKKALRERLDPDVVVEWTGVGVIAPTITAAQLRQAREVYGHPILVWDNYPVNDYVTSRLLLGPYTGREAGVARESVGVTANPMVQAEASKLALFTSAAYLWNADAYDPRAAFLASVRDLAGPGAAKWLRILAENSYSSQLDTTESPALGKLIAAFRTAYEEGSGLDRASAALRSYFTDMAATPAELRARLANPGFLKETSPWLDKTGAYGTAGLTAVDLLLAGRRGDADAVSTYWNRLRSERKALDAIPQQVSPGVMDQFLYQAMLRHAPDPGVDASFVPGSLSLKPGASGAVALRFSSAEARTVTWKLDLPDGVTASPAEGTVTVPAGGSASAEVTLTGVSEGVHSVVVSGAGVLDRALPVRVTDGDGTPRALTANFSGASVSSIDLSSGRSTEIAVGANPGEVVTSADGRTAYAANQGSNSVSVIDVTSGEVTATVAVGRVPAGLALTPDGDTLWVANYTDGTVQPVDTGTLRAGATVAVGSGPENMAITPDGRTLYVANIHDNTVSPVDLGTRRAGAAIPVGPRPFNVVAAPDGKTVYVSNSGGSTVTPIDTASNDTGPTLLVSGQAYGLGLSPDGRTLWVSPSTGDYVTPVDTVTGAPGEQITVGRSAFDVGLGWDGGTAYVTTADGNELVPVDTVSGTAGTPLPTGAYPLAVALTPVPVP
ncbi:beta-N-acetylglucosaminidase domain-containing protein [Streptomyces caniscabiei]|uniref:Beta-N-acetylglucosaminidase domain-containing protein n=1 Tax=Streptomyces caniscabiei TaxID=2746961 RepID=A0ABU4MPZ8_9ACTN|nr:beta-N-acetylglucosaminidase domain-containing protein [Streptomyces caniscabiei]MBE4739100.1 beta-N-acetylglucosaminidase domain-containing protein [Streptomyces caniscabiei]MBE4758483.1 beta-N-acetylglucosaminidase domain-containing protein [Streptomyces caniscabiei]MBE4771967.1 beta-N-acetylglucosaminidase domain-containing protein [Streptomyces caniscabiei]MBE4788028.1 beta-N-acetylglucosaminidase domain-containing protein [Streptomyces caniscabiei]MBE4797250.1 beta-N-acetylglucosaminid